MNHIELLSTNNKTKLSVYEYLPEKEIKGIVQISHGMVEYILRYELLIKYLNSKGFLVIGNDHLGHGKSILSDDDLGYFGDGLSKLVVDDLYEVTKYAKNKYGKELPYFLFGHSMGSFMARRYLVEHSNELTAAVISGTGSQPSLVLNAGIFLTKLLTFFKGERYRSQLIKKIAFGAYNKKIKDKQTNNDWLTKDKEIVQKYNNDPLCTFSFTLNGYATLFDSIQFIQNKDNINQIRKDIPIFIISGSEDPVGNYGKGVLEVKDTYLAMNFKNISCKLYEHDRHELTNELDKEIVFEDIYEFLKKYL